MSIKKLYFQIKMVKNSLKKSPKTSKKVTPKRPRRYSKKA